MSGLSYLFPILYIFIFGQPIYDYWLVLSSLISPLQFFGLIPLFPKVSTVYVNYVTTVSSSSQCTPIHSGNHPPYTPDSEKNHSIAITFATFAQSVHCSAPPWISTISFRWKFPCSVWIKVPTSCQDIVSSIWKNMPEWREYRPDSESVSDFSIGIGVSEMAECWEKVQPTSARPHVDLVPGGNGTGMRLTGADTWQRGTCLRSLVSLTDVVHPSLSVDLRLTIVIDHE